MHAMGETGASTVPAFLTKLWTLVDDTSTDELICWDVSGKSFHVFDQGRFAKEVLPLYFKHNNIASFIRQLNMYGFRKVVGVESGGLKTEKDDMEFAHQYFVRDQEGLLEFIKRKRGMSSQVPPVKADEMKIKHDDVNRVLNDVRTLKGKQDHMSSKLETVKRENELLWREVASLRQKHMKQQQIVNKLIQFLISLVQNRSMDRKRKMPLMINDASQLDEQAKVPKFSTQLSIGPGEGITEYQVLSPQDEGEADGDVMQTLSIHDITDQSPSLLATVMPSAEFIATAMPTTLTATIPSPSQDLASADSRIIDPQAILEALVNRTDDNITLNVPETESCGLEADPNCPPQFDVSQLLEPQIVSAEAPIQVTGEELLSPLGSRPGVTDAVLSRAALYPTTDTSVVPSAGRVKNPKILQREMSNHIDSLQSDLNSLKDLLAGGQYNVEPSSTLELYDMFTPWTPTEMPSTSADLSGTEVVAYNPQDIGALFDFGDLTSLYSKDDDDEVRPVTPDNSVLNTPLGTELSSPLGVKATPATTTKTTTSIKSEEVD